MDSKISRGINMVPGIMIIIFGAAGFRCWGMCKAAAEAERHIEKLYSGNAE